MKEKKNIRENIQINNTGNASNEKIVWIEPDPLTSIAYRLDVYSSFTSKNKK